MVTTRRTRHKTRKRVLKYLPSLTHTFIPEYDVIIIGAGISGLYCAYTLSKTNRVLLIDERDYVGGRIYTHPMNYEVGAARYNSSHKRLLKLIKTHGLEGVKLLKRVDYVEVSNDSIKKTDKSHIQFDNLLKHVLQHTTVSQNLRKKKFL